MSDDELIRRGDALAACAPLYGWSIAAAEELEAAIDALPPAPTFTAADLEAACRVGLKLVMEAIIDAKSITEAMHKIAALTPPADLAARLRQKGVRDD